MTKDEYVEQLREGTRTVTFLKENGEIRVMKCSLHPKWLPEGQHDDQSVHADDVVTAWDLDKDAWRSFKIGRVQAFV